MRTERWDGVQKFSFNLVEEFWAQRRYECTTNTKVKRAGNVLSLSSTANRRKSGKTHSFTPLQVLWWASLVWRANAQRTDSFPAQFELSNLDTTNGFVLNGEQAEDQSGRAVSFAGDFNGDGLADILIGAYAASPYGRKTAGTAYVVYGKFGLGSRSTFELSNLNGTNGFKLIGEQEGDRLGLSVSGAGDINGDGVDDILLGANGADPFGRSAAGKTYVVFGGKDFVKSGILDLSNMNRTHGIIIYGEQEGDGSGRSVSSAGDVNADGMDDILIGADLASPSGRLSGGKAYVIFGGKDFGQLGTLELSNLNGTNGFVLYGEQSSDFCGWSVSNAGDVNGDGIADFLIGAYGASFLGRKEVGKTYVIFGRKRLGNSGIFELSSLNGTNGFMIPGESGGDWCGRAVSNAADVNEDGIADFLIGTYVADPLGKDGAGITYVIFGGKSLGQDGILELSSLDGANGIVIHGEHESDSSGRSVSSSGDINGDGVADLIIGAPRASPSRKKESGASYIIFGGKGINNSHTLELSNLNGTNGFMINGNLAEERSGKSVSCAGDVNGDGVDDIIIGAYRAAPSKRANAGKTYVLFGHNVTLPAFPTIQRTVSSHESRAPTMTTTHPKSSSNTNSVAIFITHGTSTSNQAPLYAGITTAVVALACSLLAGGLFFWRKRVVNDEVRSMELEESNAPQGNGNYDLLPVNISNNHYKDLPQEPIPHNPDHYTSINKVTSEHDQYEAAKLQKMQANYDDLPS